MKTAKEIVAELFSLNADNFTNVAFHDVVMDAITNARCEGAEDMRERAISALPALIGTGIPDKPDEAMLLYMRTIRALPLDAMEGNQ